MSENEKENLEYEEAFKMFLWFEEAKVQRFFLRDACATIQKMIEI